MNQLIINSIRALTDVALDTERESYTAKVEDIKTKYRWSVVPYSDLLNRGEAKVWDYKDMLDYEWELRQRSNKI